MKHSDLYHYLYEAYDHVADTIYKDRPRCNEWTAIVCDKLKELIEENYTCIPKSIHNISAKELLDLIENKDD